MRSSASSDKNDKGKNASNSELKTPNVEHKSVLLREAVDLLGVKPGGIYVDGTLGAGGHAAEILRHSSPNGIVIGLDRDAEAVERARNNLASFGDRLIGRQANYRDSQYVLTELGFAQVDGVLLDLGISWFHVKSPERGFSFMLDGPLDMRMDQSQGVTAADLVNTLSQEELASLIREYGEEARAASIAKAIERARAREKITGTRQLAEIIARVFPRFPVRRIHPATLTFQALRIAVNDEIGGLRAGLSGALPFLRPGGRIAVISFHSLEDRVVKQFFAELSRGCVCPPKIPVCICSKKPEVKVLTKRPIIAGPEEVEKNPASRSAKLRAAEKL